MSEVLDPVNLMILAVAVVIFWRLRAVLGTRTGHERRHDPMASAKEGFEAGPPTPATGETAPAPAGVTVDSGRDAEDDRPVWEGFANKGTKLAKALVALREAEPEFDPRTFMQGAKMAYEMIVQAFADGDKKELKPLLSRDVYAGFAEEIDRRKKAGETLQLQFVGIDDATLQRAELNDGEARLTVRFVAQMITVTRDRSGAVIDGDDKAVREVVDVWTFARQVPSSDPNWKLVATEDV